MCFTGDTFASDNIKLCVLYHVIFEIADACVQGNLNDFNLKFSITNHG